MYNTPIVTTDVSRFGYQELNEAIEILLAYHRQKENLPDDWEDQEVSIHFNSKSGCVFLCNGESNGYQTLMLNSHGNLEFWYYCFECGAEGFAADIDWNTDEYLCGICASKETIA